MLDATETLILVGIFALAALLIVGPRLLARRSTADRSATSPDPGAAPDRMIPGDPHGE